MPVPNLIHPIPVTIEPIEAAAAVWDAEAREPLHGARSTSSFVINAQISWDLERNPRDHPAGVAEESTGYILVRYVDMDAQSVSIKRGDRITKIGARAMDLYVTGTKPRAHWPDQGGPTLVRFYFGDRQPVRRSA